MTAMKTMGIVAATLAASALIGGGAYWLYRRWGEKKQETEVDPEELPNDHDDDGVTEPVTPDEVRPRGGFMDRNTLPDDVKQKFIDAFGGYAPPKDEILDNLTQEDVILFGVKSEPVPGYPSVREEILTAKVRTVEDTVIRARISEPALYSAHLGAHAGHGFRFGEMVEVPRGVIILAARPKPNGIENYGKYGRPAATLKPSHSTKKTYDVYPGTPYDLVMPYITDDIEFHVDREMVRFELVGSKGLHQQIVFSEGSMRGDVTLRALDRDPKTGLVFVARWDLFIDP
ncbi:hypothetical protein PPSIR1_38529 [Plesiocystis pacifica SIR-1]|uniref:Uncharacterized protein n=1 Tax=Plesiocystis pacifica SIR-1 TaxID=391625 RepID=A6G8M9_9BACT|nr:hypothetical protein [Plesiocystis pacifica]EDM77806.1 hypothetical protein PPSIR1_38529 [Plesiocystis pacifica SIR-1]